MSGFIAVSVSLIGLSGVLFTLAIFIQMILSFPAMLSSNSQAYVQQQRKTYTISAGPRLEEVEEDVDEELDYEEEHEQEQEGVDDAVERWIDVVDEAMDNSSREPESTLKSPTRRSIGAMRAEPIMRGRPLRRRRPARPSKNSSTWRLDDQIDYDLETEFVDETEPVPTHDRRHCNSTWRNSMAY